MREEAAPTSKLSPLRYAVGLGLGLGLAAVQLVLLPMWLPPKEFGVLIVAISVTQALVTFGDFGYGSATYHASLSLDDRAHRSRCAVGMTLVVAGTVIVASLMLIFVGVSARGPAVGVCVGAATGALLQASRMRAINLELGGDEIRAHKEHLIWQNAPKLGMLIVAPWIPSGLAVALAGAASAAVLARPRYFGAPAVRILLKDAPAWSPGLILVVSGFALSWVDTYMVGLVSSLAVLAAYQVAYRLFASLSYFYLPVGSVLVSRVARGARRAAVRLTILTLAGLTALAVFVAAAFHSFASTLWPSYHFSLSWAAPLGLVAVASGASYMLGLSLLTAGKPMSVAWANLFGVVIMLAGHAAITREVGPKAAPWVAAVSFMATGVAQFVLLRRTWSK